MEDLNRINTKKAFRLLWRYLLVQKWKITWGILATIAIGLMELFTGALLKFLTNTVTKIQGISGAADELKIPVKLNLDLDLFNRSTEIINTTLKGSEAILKGIIIISLVFFVLYLLQGLFLYLREIFMNLAIERVLQKFKSDILRAVLSSPVSFFNKNSTGDIISRVNYDLTVLTDTINLLVEISRFAIYMLMFIPAMFFINAQFAFYTVLFFPVSFILIRIIASVIKKSSLNVSDNVGDYNSFLEERINRLRFIKVNTTEQAEQDKFDKLVEQNYQYRKRLIFQRFFLKPSNEVLGMLVLAVLFIFFSKQLLAGSTNLGDIAFFLYLVKTSFKPVKKVAMAVGDLNMALISTGKIEEVFEIEKEYTGKGEELPGGKIRTLAISDLHFSYNGNKVLKGVNLSLREGDRILLSGDTGAGKTTLCSVLTRLIMPGSGSVLINDMDVYTLSIKSVREALAYVSGETPLISATVTENLLYGTNASEKDISKFSDLLPEWVFSDPDRLLGGEETNITSGEARQIALVRALLAEPSLLILDEAFAYMDDASIERVLSVIPRDIITIVVSKNPVVNKFVDKSYRLKDGIIA